VYRGRSDVSLNEQGVAQAKLLGEYLGEWALEAVYSSPLQRARATAEAIARPHGIAVTIAPALVDFDYGDWQGSPEHDIIKRYPQLYAEWLTAPHRVRMPSGESLAEVAERASAFVEHIIAAHTDGVLLVSHRVVNKVLICQLLELDNSHFWSIRQDVGGITMFDYENGRFILSRHNDTSYSRGLAHKRLGDF